VVHVLEGEHKPIQCSDGFFWRQGAATQKLSRDELREFFQKESAVRFDNAVHPRFRYPQDFDTAKFTAWLAKSRVAHDAHIEDVLVNIEAAERRGRPLRFRNAGVLFFAREVRRFFTQAYVTCLLFRGSDRVHVLDRKDFDDGIAADIEAAVNFVERNTRTAYRIERLQREEIAEYPMAAIREAITNAVMHRDWFNEGANVFVEIYDGRIEITSPGGLPKGLHASDLGRRSVRRNPLIADLLHRIAFIEKAGTGIRRMRDDARAHRCPSPAFTEGTFFTVTFRPSRAARAGTAAAAPQPGMTPQVTPQATPQVTPQVRAVLRRAADASTRDDLQRAAGIGDREHFRTRYMLPLLAAGWLAMTIPDKPRSSKQRYVVTPEGEDALSAFSRVAKDEER
jgi:ATP-dependent DNA helicase RecG